MKNQEHLKIQVGFELIPEKAISRNCTHFNFGIALISKSDLRSFKKAVK